MGVRLNASKPEPRPVCKGKLSYGPERAGNVKPAIPLRRGRSASAVAGFDRRACQTFGVRGRARNHLRPLGARDRVRTTCIPSGCCKR